MKIEILKVTRDIASDVSHIYAYSWKTAYRGIVPQPYLDGLSLERWTPILQENKLGVDAFVLKADGEFVATSAIAPARDESMSGWGEIISIFVLPEHFHKGYGKKLFSYVIEQLHGRGFDNIYLWVLEENQQARAFYERNGFIPNGDKGTINIGQKEIMEVRYIRRTK